MKKAVIAVILATVCIAAGLYVWQWRNTGNTDDLVFYGNVDVRQIALAFDGSGRISSLDVEEGDSVASGQVIGHLNTRTLQLQARAQEAVIEAERQSLLKLRNGTRPEEIDQARAHLSSAKAAEVLAEQEFDRAARLLASNSGAGSQQSVDHARAQAEVARAAMRQAEAALTLALSGPRVEDIAAAEAQLDASQATLDLLRYKIDEGTLRAPADSVVRSRLREPGDMVTPAIPVFALALTEPKWIRIHVGEPDLGRIRPGMTAQILTDSQVDHPVTGTIGYISSVAEFTPKSVQTAELRTSLVYEVHVTVRDTSDTMRLGQPVTVRLHAGAVP
ncbi:MAG: HlyD family efflux transporter periplasmic adaptor subunit [Geminicoccaceae bacterium]